MSGYNVSMQQTNNPKQEGSNLESEITELQKLIELKRRELEGKQGIVREGKELIKETVGEHFANERKTQAPQATQVTDDTAAQGAQSNSSAPSTTYLDNLSADSTQKVNSLIEIVGSKGIRAAIKEAEAKDPFILDAFHDALVDRLHGELKRRGIIK
jgi:hypothetical protein